MKTEVPEENQEESPDHGSDWDRRVLCSDGNCIGVIGPDGHCKECGKAFDGELPEMAPSEDKDEPETEDGSQAKDESQAEDESPARETAEINETSAAPIDEAWENRVLCSDGNCIGIIGPDGKCKECGKPQGMKIE